MQESDAPSSGATIDSLSPAQQESAGVLLSMGFSLTASCNAATLFGEDIERAVNWITDETIREESNANAASSSMDPSESKENTGGMMMDRSDVMRSTAPTGDLGAEMLAMINAMDLSPSISASAPSAMDEMAVENPPEEVEREPSITERRCSIPDDEIREQFLSHKATFYLDVHSLKRFPTWALDAIDLRGNTPLAIATRLNYDEVAHAILEAGGDPNITLGCGWNVMQEACLLQNERLVRDLLLHKMEIQGVQYERKRQEMLQGLSEMNDFKLEIKWEIQSSIPLVGGLINSMVNIDNFKIWKRGRSLRFDSFVRGFSGMQAKEGHLSFLFTEAALCLVDHDQKTFQNALRKYKNPDYDEFEHRVKVLTQTENGRSQLLKENLQFDIKKTWLGYDRVETIEGWDCTVYGATGLCFSTIEQTEDDIDDWKHPEFDQYFDADIEDLDVTPSYIGRRDTAVNSNLWLCPDYPLQPQMLGQVLEAISIASEDMQRLADIFQLDFPCGFPVQLDFPLMVGVSVSVTFCNFEWCECEEELFAIPRDYRLL